MYNSQVTESASNIVEMRSTAHSYPAAWMLATSNEIAWAALLSDTVILRWLITAEVCVRTAPGGRSP
jgi:hypothetical protein